MWGPGDGGHESGPGPFERWTDDFARNLGGSIVDVYDGSGSRGHAFRPSVVMGQKRNGWASARTDFGDKRVGENGNDSEGVLAALLIKACGRCGRCFADWQRIV